MKEGVLEGELGGESLFRVKTEESVDQVQTGICQGSHRKLGVQFVVGIFFELE